MGKFGDTRGGVGKSGVRVLENKSGNISETRKDRGKVTMGGLYELTIALSKGTIPTPYSLPFPKGLPFPSPPATPTQACNLKFRASECW